MRDLPDGPAPAVMPPVVGSGDAGRLAAALAPGLRDAFGDCLSEALPAGLADLLGRLDRTLAARDDGTGPSRVRHDQRPRAAHPRGSRSPDSFERS